MVEAETDHAPSSSPATLRGVILTLATGALVLGAFDFFSAGSEVARRGLSSQRPPIYGRFEPGFSATGVLAVILAIAAALAASAAVRREPKVRVLLPIAIVFMFAFAAAVATVDGAPDAFTDPLQRVHPPDYQADVHLVQERSVRAFTRQHPELMPQMRSVHSRTHPPGPLVFLAGLERVFPNALIPRALVLTFLGALVLVPTWYLARTMVGERAALYAVVLLAAAPAPVIFSVTSMDSVFATLLAATGLALFWALGHAREARWAMAAGVLAGLMTYMTYGVAFVAAGAAVYAFTRSPARQAIRLLALAAVGGLAALVLMRLVLGFDLLASFRASYQILADESDRSYLYWVVGNPAVWLTFAGLPIAALGMREALVRRPRFLLSLFVPLVLIDLNHKFAGETERIGQFAYPFLAAAAGGWLARTNLARSHPWLVPALVMFTAFQTIALEALFYTYW